MIGRAPILIFGLPRSGTSWIARIFDSHPWTLYRHEPDTRFLDSTLPVAPEADDVARAGAAARAYLDRCLMLSREKQAGSPPFPRKAYRSAAAEGARRAVVYGLKGLSRRAPGLAGAVPVPDLVRARDRDQVRIVWKSVVATTQLGAYARLLPEARCILLVRHPGGQILSQQRGRAEGYLRGAGPGATDGHGGIGWLVKAIAERPFGARHGFAYEDFEQAEPWARRALVWAIQNQAAMDGIAGLGNARLVRYEDVATNPLGAARDLLGFAGLDWDPACAAFIQATSRAPAHGTAGYFDLQRDSARQAVKWREQLDDATVARLGAVVTRFPVGRLYADSFALLGARTAAP